MQAVGEKKANTESAIVRIPEEFEHKEIEIIVLPFYEITSRDQKATKLAQFDRLVENAEKRNIRIDKSIDIDAIMNEMNNGLYRYKWTGIYHC